MARVKDKQIPGSNLARNNASKSVIHAGLAVVSLPKPVKCVLAQANTEAARAAVMQLEVAMLTKRRKSQASGNTDDLGRTPLGSVRPQKKVRTTPIP